jgi:hypothetical protein
MAKPTVNISNMLTKPRKYKELQECVSCDNIVTLKRKYCRCCTSDSYDYQRSMEKEKLTKRI